VPGFLPDVGDMLGQKRQGGIFSPGLDYAFGFVNDSYLDKAKQRGWLIGSDSVATPATIANTEDIQVKMTLEPFTDVKIDLNMSRTDNRNKSIQYMYGAPPTHSGSFNMTTISIGSAFASTGSASNGYYSKTFQKFQDNLNVYQRRVEDRYRGIQYPAGTGMSGTFNPENGTVNKYSADVMVPAFLDDYTGSSSLDIFPSLLRMLPNWSINYRGLSNLPWVRDHFKSVNLTHAYKSVYAVGSYHSYSSWIECMGSGGLGFIQNTTTGGYTPNSLLDVSTVSINENFSPLIGINATLNNNMTFKAEYKTTRVLNLSMTSAQLTETGSKDFVLGFGYKINDFKLSSIFRSKRASEIAARNSKSKGKAANNSLKGNLENDKPSGNARGGNTGKQKIAHDLNLRFDFSIRNQSAIKRDLQTNLCEATSGSKAFKTSAQVDYTLSRMVTLSLYYDRQRSEPLLSSSSYPTITQDFGMSMKFSLTR
jgi:cell surface protein SprA